MILIPHKKIKMNYCDQSGFYLFLTLAFVLACSQKCSANYNSTICGELTENGAILKESPYFFRNFRVLSESVVTDPNNPDTAASVSQEDLWYSEMYKEVMRYKKTQEKWTWLHIDELANDCIFKETGGQCVDHPRTCRRKAKEFIGEDGRLTIGSHKSIVQWPSLNKKQVDLGKGSVRGIMSKKYATCDYDNTNDVTTVTLWHIFDDEKYPAMDEPTAILLMAHHRRFKNDKELLDERIDYADDRLLSDQELFNGIQIGESKCGHIEGQFRSIQAPKPSTRHGFISEHDIAAGQQVSSEIIYDSYTEYNYNSQILFMVQRTPVHDENEAATTVQVYDFSTQNYFQYSATNGGCYVYPHIHYRGSSRMPTPEEFWLFTSDKKSSYLGIYINREIPCNTWLFEYPNGALGYDKDTTITLFLATPDWLAGQGMPRDMFYPVQKIIRSKYSNSFESFYEFKDNPGYHIPQLDTCFDLEDTVNGRITIQDINYYKMIAHREIHFEYEFRTFIQRTAGIVSHMRVAQIKATPSLTEVDEIDVTFRIFGNFVGINRTNSAAYEPDPVTSQEAAEKVRKAVDKGDVKFQLDGQSVTLHLKKGSFSVLKNNEFFENVDHPEQSRVSGGGGYSDIVMAFVGLTLLFVGLALSVLAVYIYKRWSEGQDILPSFGMQTLNNDK